MGVERIRYLLEKHDIIYGLVEKVDFTTGHVKFDKNIFVTGTIKNGFRVEGIDVVANQVDSGHIKAKGDIYIQRGAPDP